MEKELKKGKKKYVEKNKNKTRVSHMGFGEA